jgi:hypothetical protein
MKNLLYHLNAVKTGTQKAVVGAGAGFGNFLKVGAGAGAETNSFGFTTLGQGKKSIFFQPKI